MVALSLFPMLLWTTVVGARLLFRRLALREEPLEEALVLGIGALGRVTGEDLTAHGRRRIAGYLAFTGEKAPSGSSLPVLGRVEELEEVLCTVQVDVVYIAGNAHEARPGDAGGHQAVRAASASPSRCRPTPSASTGRARRNTAIGPTATCTSSRTRRSRTRWPSSGCSTSSCSTAGAVACSRRCSRRGGRHQAHLARAHLLQAEARGAARQDRSTCSSSAPWWSTPRSSRPSWRRSTSRRAPSSR